MEADLTTTEVQFCCVKPILPRSTGSAMPLGVGKVDGCRKSMWVVMRLVSKQTQLSCHYSWTDRQLVGSAPGCYFPLWKTSAPALNFVLAVVV